MTPGREQIFYPRTLFEFSLDKGLLDDAAYQISKTCAFYFHTRRILELFLICVYLKHDPCIGDIFYPRATTLTFLEEVH